MKEITITSDINRLKKADIIEQAKQKSSEISSWQNPMTAQVILKKMKLFIDTMIGANEPAAVEEFEQDKERWMDIASFSSGGVLKDYEKDPVYADLLAQLKQRKELLDLAFKSKDPIYDADGVEVPKVPVKSYRKDSLRIKL